MLAFLRPSLWKILLAVILFSASSVLWRAYILARISDTFPYGFPFQFYLAWGPCPAGQSCSEFNALFLLFDVLLWYAVSAWIVNRLRRTERSL